MKSHTIEYYLVDEADEKIEGLEREVSDLKDTLFSEQTQNEVIVLEFAKWCNKNNVNADKIPHHELEFEYEKFKHQNSQLFS